MRNKANTLLIKENMTIREKNREIRYTGTFDSNARGFGFVKVEGFERDLFIPEGRDGGAVYGDTVEVRILKGSVDENGRSDDGRGRRAEAEVTAIIERGIRQIVGPQELQRQSGCRKGQKGADGEHHDRRRSDAGSAQDPL